MNIENNRQVRLQDGQGEALKPGALGYNTPPPPAREAMLRSVYAQAQPQERHMSFITRIFTGRRWYVQAGIALALLCALGLMWINPLKPSYAQETAGYMLKYDLGNDGGNPASADAAAEQLHQQLHAQFHKALQDWVDKKKAEAKTAGEKYESKVVVSMTNKNGQQLLTVGMAGASKETMEELKAALSGVAGLPEPQVVDATWFSDGPLDLSGAEGSLSLVINDHQFSFGPGFTQDQVADTLNKWLAENNPGAKAKVVVNRTTGPDGKEEMSIDVRVEGGDDGKDADAAVNGSADATPPAKP